MSFALSTASAGGASGSRVHLVNGGTGKPVDWLAKSSSRKQKKAKKAALTADTDGIRLIQVRCAIRVVAHPPGLGLS